MADRNQEQRDPQAAELEAKFQELYGPGSVDVFFAPGRVNLIGEHIDYSGGHVFPCALTLGTYGAARRRSDRKLRFYSVNFPEGGIIESSLDDLVFHKEAGWTNYVKGVIWAYAEHGCTCTEGFDFMCSGTIPNKSGLSSSASLEVLTGTVLMNLFGFQVDQIHNALYGQYAENRFVGMNCGIMDQFASAMGKKNKAIFLNTATLDYKYAPVPIGDAKIVIVNTNKPHELTDSAYNTRREECEEALKDLQTVVPIQALCDLTPEQFEAHKSAIRREVCCRRAKHAVYENERTLKAVEALNAGDLATFGELLKQSHLSLQHDYEVTGKELDTLAEAAWAQPGVIGARMTGGGFGGCTVNIVKTDSIPAFIENVGKAYLARIGYAASFYVVEIGDGPSKV